MGYDCTLHVVDEAVFARVCKRVLSGKRPRDEPAPLAELVAETRRLLAADPEAGARAMAELALAYASSETPYASARGLALSLWDLHADALGKAPPKKLFGDVEALLAPVLAKYPKACGKVPRSFDGNGCVGAFVPAKHVPAMLGFVERAVAAVVPGDRDRYEPLVRVLGAAAARAMAYWEATDLAVAPPQAGWFADAAAAPPAADRGVLEARWPGGPYLHLVAVAPQRRLVFEADQLHDVRLESWPPAVTTRPWHAPYATPTPWGTLLARVATDKRDGAWTWELREEPQGAAQGAALVHGELVAVGGAVLAVGDRGDGIQAIRDDGRIQRLAMPPIDTKNQWSADRFAVAFGDGSALVGWYREVYRWDGRGTKLTRLPGKLLRPDGPGAVVELPDGRLAGGFGRKLLAVARDGTQRTLAPLDNVMHLALGPEEALIVGEGDNPEGDLLKIVWTGSREIAHVARAVFGLTGGDTHVALVYCDLDRARLVCLCSSARQRLAWRAVAWDVIAALPRTKLADYTKARAAMQRKRRAAKKRR